MNWNKINCWIKKEWIDNESEKNQLIWKQKGLFDNPSLFFKIKNTEVSDFRSSLKAVVPTCSYPIFAIRHTEMEENLITLTGSTFAVIHNLSLNVYRDVPNKNKARKEALERICASGVCLQLIQLTQSAKVSCVT